jgi:predicted aconitase with swiveling domain
MGKISTTLKSKRSVTGKTIIFNEPVDLESALDFKTGKIIQAGHVHEGKSIKNKIVVAPTFLFNPDLEYLIYLLAKNDCNPKGVVVEKASSSLILGAVMADIPIVYGLTDKKMEILRDKESLTINLEKQSVEIR